MKQIKKIKNGKFSSLLLWLIPLFQYLVIGVLLSAVVVKADFNPTSVSVNSGFPTDMNAGNTYTATYTITNLASQDNNISLNFTISRNTSIDSSEFILKAGIDSFAANCTADPVAQWSCTNGTDMFAFSPLQSSTLTLNLTLNPAANPEPFNYTLIIFGDLPIQVTPASTGGGGTVLGIGITTTTTTTSVPTITSPTAPNSAGSSTTTTSTTLPPTPAANPFTGLFAFVTSTPGIGLLLLLSIIVILAILRLMRRNSSEQF